MRFLYLLGRFYLEKISPAVNIIWRQLLVARLRQVKSAHRERRGVRSARQEHANDGLRLDRARPCLLRRLDRLHLRLRPPVREIAPMIFEYSLAGLVTVALLVYLVYALLRPEYF